MKRFTIIISFIMLTFMPLMAQVKQTVAVLGDSYSTFEGFIPKGYATWYSPTTPAKTTDVNKVEQTWWWQVIKEGGYKMGNINSYSCDNSQGIHLLYEDKGIFLYNSFINNNATSHTF